MSDFSPSPAQRDGALKTVQKLTSTTDRGGAVLPISLPSKRDEEGSERFRDFDTDWKRPDGIRRLQPMCPMQINSAPIA